MLKRLVFFAWLSAVFAGTGEAEDEQAKVQEHVARAVQPGMERHGTPGMAVAIVINGQSYVFNYGLASKESGTPVGSHTLFEIGSVTKTFTATLTSYAQVTGRLSLSDHVSKYFPALQGSRFGEVTLLNLGTHTPGGLPLQVPNDVTNDDQLITTLRTGNRPTLRADIAPTPTPVLVSWALLRRKVLMMISRP